MNGIDFGSLPFMVVILYLDISHPADEKREPLCDWKMNGRSKESDPTTNASASLQLDLPLQILL